MKGKLARVAHDQVMWAYPDCGSRYDMPIYEGELLLIVGALVDLGHGARWVVYSQRLRKKGTVAKRNVEVLDNEG